MCLGIPMKVKDIEGNFARVKTGNLLRKINVEMLKDLKVGDYVIVHAGFGIEVINPQEAKKTLELINEIESTD